jgi:coiled-coil domain-containing protein 130
MGKYIPPEHEGLRSGNSLHSKRPPGHTSKPGVLTVRFEMPFPIWCTTCPKPTIIGQGVRFNAEKKKVGNYFSTPIYSFRMKHVACGGTIEIKTDPKNTAYVVTEGARKRDTGEDKIMEGDIVIMTEEEREKLRQNAFAGLEGKVEEKQRFEGAKKRIHELQAVQKDQWEDPYEQNKKLRAAFREGRHQREKTMGTTVALQDKMSLGLDLLPESEEDSIRAGLVEFGDDDTTEQALSRPLFGNNDAPKIDSTSKETSRSKSQTDPSKSKHKLLKAETIAAQRKSALAATLQTNTRVRLDPFLSNNGSPRLASRLALGIKRKRNLREDERPAIEDAVRDITGQDSTPRSTGLVEYDSD